jgi:hypothetical protein
VEQIGWADEFGNLFPMGAWKPAQRTHHDAHKTAWRPVFLHPPAAEVQRLRDALKPFAAIDLTTNQSVDAMDVLRARIDTADHVFHAPTGETWVVKYVRGDNLAWCGWPPGEAKLGDCTLVKKASSVERESLLREMEGK